MDSTNNADTKIFYFSSTGNSLVTARKIAEKLENTKIYSIPAIINTEIDFLTGRIIVVFPVYIWGLPNIIRQFFEKMHFSQQTKLFVVATNAGLAGDPIKMVEKILKKKQLQITSGFLVWMPENFTARYDVWPLWLQKLSFSLVERKIDRIYREIKTNQTGKREKSRFGINWFLTIQHNFLMHKIFVEKSLKAKDYLWAAKNCSGCGICSKICPVENINMQNGRPLWGDHCEICVGCLQWCPQQAVQFKKTTLRRGRYHHPDVSLNDFIMR